MIIGQIRLVAGIAILSQILLVSRADAAPFSGGIVVERVGGDPILIPAQALS